MKHNKVFFIFLTIMSLVSLMLFAATGYSYLQEYGPGIVNWGNNVKYGGTLKEVMPWGPQTLNFNPFVPTNLPTHAIYEPLFYVNMLNGDTTNLLGTSYKFEDNNLKLVITTRNDVKWSDGTPFTAQDVAFTFNYIKEYPAIDGYGIWSKISDVQSVVASGDTVIFTFSKPNVALFPFIASQPIVPAHIWANIKDPSTYTNPNPIGTGPFMLKSFSPDKVVLVKNPNYWMKGRPYIDQVDVSYVVSNTTAYLYMLKHEADWSFLFAPDPITTYVDKDPSVNKIWWPTYSVNGLVFNTQKYPFDNPIFRRAISIAIDKNKLEKEVYFGTGGYNPNQAGLIPTQYDWMDPSLEATNNYLNTYNPQEAQKLLASIGFVKNSAGQLVGPDGKVLPPIQLVVCAGCTDFISMGNIISSELGQLGISVNVNQQSGGTYMGSITTGTYDMVIYWGIGGGPTPYYEYYTNLNPAFSAPKLGEPVISDISRYTNPIITESLKEYSQTTDPTVQKQAIYKIERVFLNELPYVSLTNRTNFNIYNESTITGFPSDQYPYSSGGSPGAAIGLGSSDLLMTLLNVHLK
ncbi:ABC transporter substrate-binding protein [Athalassotoga saccharophila]|uniref:ABC transporter substrate-binding protein n=1 Tax=Athalassotoga saccharophila TaxID=1441386 RepID=UPI00137AB195|nr:ABC transporter substrate-binding protein [Athalassotoga saccharophila]BBJ28693.1 periplasmic dipeptide transport protein [Athalassotoga saccharophila]